MMRMEDLSRFSGKSSDKFERIELTEGAIKLRSPKDLINYGND
jgi:hypothetical protein